MEHDTNKPYELAFDPSHNANYTICQKRKSPGFHNPGL